MRKKGEFCKKIVILVKNTKFMLHFNDICTKIFLNLMQFAIDFFKKIVYNIRVGWRPSGLPVVNKWMIFVAVW